MEPDNQHKVLIADDDENVGKTISRVLHDEDIVFVFADNGDLALEEIKNRKDPFSIIIANQGLTGINGETLLENAKHYSPESGRFLMGTYSEFSAIIEAVNKDLIQQYIVKPLKDDEFLNAVRYGIKYFDSFFENEKLLNLAKKQNSQLYELSCRFMEAATLHTKKNHDLDCEIDILEKKILALSAPKPSGQRFVLDLIAAEIKNDAAGIDAQKAQTLFSCMMKAIYHEFDRLARQKGFEMPPIKRETA